MLICKAANFHLRNIRAVRKYLTPEAAAIAINSFVFSRLDYANALLYGLPMAQISRLQRVQNSAARILTNKTRRENIRPELKKMHWLPITRRIQYKLLVLTYRAIEGTAPPYLCELVALHQPARELRSSEDTTILAVPRTKLKCGGDRAFQAAAPTLWNSLPSSLRHAGSLNIFKTLLE